MYTVRQQHGVNKSRKRGIWKLYSEVAYEKLQAAEISQKQESVQDAANKVKLLDAEIAIMKLLNSGVMDVHQLISDIHKKMDLLEDANSRKKDLQAKIAENEKSIELLLQPDEIANGEELRATIAGLKATIAVLKRLLPRAIKEENELQTDIFTKEKVREIFNRTLNLEDEIASKVESLQAAVAHRERLQAEFQCKQNTLLAETANKEKLWSPTFGPLYTKYESPIWRTGKETAWDHVLSRAENSEESDNTIQIYLHAMRKIEEEARQTYEEGAVDDLDGYEFQWMMIKDGCFLSQLALFYLGASQQLDYPSTDLIFGERSNNENVKKGINSMFFVGNQIPLIVLEELMKQDYFQEVVKSKQNWELPSDLPGQVLYQFLLLPALASRNLTLCAASQGRDQRNFFSLKPSDLLHGLHLLVLGQGRDYGPEYRREEGDLEAGHWLEDSSNNDNEISSATELKQTGVNFTRALVERKGIRGITFKDYMFRAFLFLPKLMVDEDTELLFQNLKDYEITQKLCSSKREVSSYLQFMSELIRTPEDAELLVAGGIIKARRSQREKLSAILSRLASEDTTQSLRLIRLGVSNYSRLTWKKFRDFVMVILMILTFIQTVYSVVSCHMEKY